MSNTKKYAPKLPLELDSNSNFIKIEDALNNVKQKLRMIILTNPGEKIMNPFFGVGIKKYLFESEKGIITFLNDTKKTLDLRDFQSTIANSITNQIISYCDDITIYNIQTDVRENSLYITINYNYKNTLNDSLEIVVGA
jgi:hypothetical protein